LADQKLKPQISAFYSKPPKGRVPTTIYDQALHQEKVLAGNLMNAKRHAQELARQQDD